MNVCVYVAGVGGLKGCVLEGAKQVLNLPNIPKFEVCHLWSSPKYAFEWNFFIIIASDQRSSPTGRLGRHSQNIYKWITDSAERERLRKRGMGGGNREEEGGRSCVCVQQLYMNHFAIFFHMIIIEQIRKLHFFFH